MSARKVKSLSERKEISITWKRSILVGVERGLLKATLSCKLPLSRYDIIDYFSPTANFPSSFKWQLLMSIS